MPVSTPIAEPRFRDLCTPKLVTALAEGYGLAALAGALPAVRHALVAAGVKPLDVTFAASETATAKIG